MFETRARDAMGPFESNEDVATSESPQILEALEVATEMQHEENQTKRRSISLQWCNSLWRRLIPHL